MGLFRVRGRLAQIKELKNMLNSGMCAGGKGQHCITISLFLVHIITSTHVEQQVILWLTDGC
jgi:hypothetical protein